MADKKITYQVEATGVEKVQSAAKDLVKTLTDSGRKAADAGKAMASAYENAQKAVEAIKDPLNTARNLASKTATAIGKAGESITTGWRGAVGTIGRVTGTIWGVTLGVGLIIGKVREMAAEWRDFGSETSAKMGMLTQQFRALLGSLQAAKQRTRELLLEVASTPFLFADWIESNKILQNLTGGMLATKNSMRMVGDAAAATGADLQRLSTYVGQLYGNLKGGAPIGMAVAELREMGAISGATANAVVSMNESGAGFVETWALVETELKKNQGAMKNLQKEIEGLQNTFQDAKYVMEAGFGAGFDKTKKAELEAAIATYKALTPVVENFGSMLGHVDGMFGNTMREIQTGLSHGIESSKQFGETIGAAVSGGFLAFTAAMSIGTMQMAQFAIEAIFAANSMAKMNGVGAFFKTMLEQNALALKYLTSGHTELAAEVYKSIIANSLDAAALNKNTASTAVNSGTKLTLGSVLTMLSGKLREGTAFLASMTAWTWGNTAATGAQTTALTLSARATLFLQAAQKGLIVSFGILKNVAISALSLIRTGLQFLIGGPVGLALVSIAALVGVFAYLATSAANAAKKLNDYNKATDDLIKRTKQQIDGIRTQNDLLTTQSKIYSDIIQAKEELAAAEEKGEKSMADAARKKIAGLEAQLREANKISTNNLERSDSEKTFNQSQYEGERRKEELKREYARSRMNPTELAKDEIEKFEKLRADRDRVMNRKQSRKDLADKAQSRGEKITANMIELANAEQQLKNAQKPINLSDVVYPEMDPVSAGQAIDAANAERNQAIADAEQKIKDLNDAIYAGRGALADAIETGDPLLQIEALAAAYDKLTKFEDEIKREDATPQQKRAAELQRDATLAEINSSDIGSIRSALYSAGIESSEIDKTLSGDKTVRPRAVENLKTARDRLQALEADQADPSKLREQEIIARQAIEKVSQMNEDARVESEQQIAALKLKGLDAELVALGFAKQKLQLEYDRKNLTDEMFAAGNKAVEAQEESARRIEAERNQDARLESEAQIAGYKLQGFAAEMAMIKFARERLRIEEQRKDKSEQVIESERNALDAQEQKIIEMGLLRQQQAQEEMQLGNLQSGLKLAQESGDIAGASDIQSKIDTMQNDIAIRDTQKQADELFDALDPAKQEFIDGMAQLRAAALDARKALEELALKELRGETKANQMERSIDEASRKGVSGGKSMIQLENELDKLVRENQLAKVNAEAASQFTDPAKAEEFRNLKMADFDAQQKAEQEARRQKRMDEARSIKEGFQVSQLNLQAAMATAQNDPDKARGLRSKAAEIEERAAARERYKELLSMGAGSGSAFAIADRERRMTKANRMLEDLPSQGINKVVADSLTSIGGGGGVYAVNNERELSKERNRLLKEIATAVKQNSSSAGRTWPN